MEKGLILQTLYTFNFDRMANMKERIANAYIVNGIKIIVFVLIFIITGNYFMNILCYKDTGGGIGMYRFHKEQKNTMDIIFFGSSHTHCTVDVGYLWNQYGIAGCNLTAGAQKLDGVYCFMKDAFRTQHPKIVVVDIYSALDDGLSKEEEDLYRVSSVHWSYDYIQYVKNFGNRMGRESEWIRAAQLKYPLFHSRYQEISKDDFIDNMSFMKGYRGSFEVTPFERPEAFYDEHITEISVSSKEYLDKICELTKENDVKLLLMAAPYEVLNEQQEQYNWIREYAAENEIPYINFNHAVDGLELDYGSDFRDVGHLNNIGAQKVTESLITYARNFVSFEDHRNDSKYDSWNDNSCYLHNKLIARQLQVEGDVNDYLKQVSNIANDKVIILTLNGNYNAIPDAYANGLALFGIGAEDYLQGGSWIIKNGQVLKRMPGNVYQMNMKVENSEIQISAEQIVDDAGDLYDKVSTDCNGINYSENLTNGMNIIVYDEHLGMVIDVVTNDIYNGLVLFHMDLSE